MQAAREFMLSQLQKDSRLGELMRLAQQGDRAAYIELLQEITPRLRHAVRKRMPFLQPQDIDDLVQNMLLALHSVRMTYDPRRPFQHWLMGSARTQTAEHTPADHRR